MAEGSMVDEETWETRVAWMARIGTCGSPSFSPDGTRIAFVSDLNGIPQVWIVPTEGGWPELVTALDDQINSVAWSPTGEWLSFLLSPGGGMNVQIYVVRPDGSGLRRLTDGGKENNLGGAWTPDGRYILMASNRRGNVGMDTYLLDPTTGEMKFAGATGGIGNFTDVSRDGHRAVLYRMAQRGDNNLFLRDLITGEEHLLTPHEGPGTFDHARFSSDGKTLYLLSNKNRERIAFARILLAPDGSPGEIEVIAGREDAECERYALTKDGRTAALLWNIAGRSELVFLDLATLETTPGPTLPSEIAGQLTFSQDERFLAMECSGSVTPQDIWVLDRNTRRMWQVTHSPHAGVDLAAMVRPELVRFSAHDGLELTGWLYRPREAAAPGPIVLSFHGGPEGQERPIFNSQYQALVAQGIAVFAPNVRGSSGFGKTFVNLDNGALRVNAVRDIEACVNYVIQAGIAVPGRIGIRGGSYGGYMTMAGLTEYPDLFAAGANLFGIVNFETFFAHTEPWMAAISKIEYGDPDTEAEMLRSLSPIHRIDRVIAPTIVLHGANDTNVPVVEAEQVVASLKARNIPVEYILFPDEGHGFRKTVNRVHSVVAATRWFVEHLASRL